MITPHQQSALTLALSQKGMREHPPGSNDQKYSRYFGFGPQFWCADFVGFCMDKTGNRDHKVPWGYPSAVANIAAWGERTGKMHGQPRKGDIFVVHDDNVMPPRSKWVHTGFVSHVNGSSFMTVEGNTSGPGPGGDVYVASHSRGTPPSGQKYFFVGPWS